MISETQFKKKVMKDLETLPNCWFYKSQEVGRKGIPDIIMCLNGIFVAIELKRDGKMPDPIQKIVMSHISDARGYAFWTTPTLWENLFPVLKQMAGVS